MQDPVPGLSLDPEQSEKSDTDNQKIILDLQRGEEFGFAEFFSPGYGGLNTEQ
jgi:hypothetical protein